MAEFAAEYAIPTMAEYEIPTKWLIGPIIM
jgi:hypothetical protein